MPMNPRLLRPTSRQAADPTGAYIDELRVTKGSARQYTGDTYVVPTLAYQEG